MRMRVAGFLLAGVMLAAVRVDGADGTKGDVQPEKSVAQLVADVGSADYGTRDGATWALMKLSADHRPEIEAALARTSNEEAIARLEKVAVHLFMKAQTGFEGKTGLMGIRMSAEAVQLDPKNQVYQACIVVWKTQPGFPAAEVLQSADRLVAVNGTPFPMAMDPDAFKALMKGVGLPYNGDDNITTLVDGFRKMVNVAGGGKELTFTVIRNGKALDVKVKLAGLGDEDSNPNLLGQMVDRRDQMAEEYRANLKTGRAAAVAVQRDAGAQYLYNPTDGLGR